MQVRKIVAWIVVFVGSVAFINSLVTKTTAAPVPDRTSVWQWSVPVTGGVDKTGPSRAFLWIPQSCPKVRGVIISQNNMEEEMILENPKFRRAMAELGFAEIWVSPAFNFQFRFDQGAGDVFNSFMTDLANVSGYHELTYAPMVPMGHSAQASWPYYFAAWNPGRTLAALSVSGQWPYFRDKTFAPDIWGDKTIDYIPSLECMGEYEAADTWSREGLYERQQHPLLPLSMAAGPAQSHFIASEAKIDYLILYIKKAAQYRLPKNWNASAPPTLIPIDPTKMGWLVDKYRKNEPPTAEPAPVNQYKGDPKEAFWYFDEEMAKATSVYEAVHRGKKVDLLGFVQDSKVVPQSNSHLQVTLKFQPQPDGITFKLTPTFLDTVPGESPRPSGWTGLPVGSPVGHASGGGSISVDRIVGPFEKIGPDMFVVSLQKEILGTEKQYELVFAATHPGDDQYRPTVQQAHLYIPARNTQGTDQKITFPLIPNQKPTATSMKLHATSDAGMPVSYYVQSGPAVIDGDTLTFTQIPPNAKFPVKVRVVAWQYGRSIEPFVKTADPVGCEFYITESGGTAPSATYFSLLSAPSVIPVASVPDPAIAAPPVVQTSNKNAISFNICDKFGMAPGDLSGAETRVGNWNNIKPGTPGTPIILTSIVNKEGKAVPRMTATVTGGSAESHIYDDSSDANATSNDARSYNGVFDQFDGGAATIEITGIPFAHYDVYFYRRDDGNNRAGKFTIGSLSLFVRGGKGNPGSDGKGYVRSMDTSLGAGTDIAQGNYVEFESVSGSTLNANFSAVNAGDDVQRSKVIGFQIVERK